ncbi:rod-binding protein [Prosthecomicrobium hirschii]|mgnify:FL=1|uniref:Flagellar protein FlgJ N-terminal domain-containing protein n=3 Tax=Ancalomicrobiaceae TaxID=2172021 RepID=A0A0N8GEJ9_9HYPH|nr:rod-binding protein [Prosthecomicrobium hirschii]KPL51729.1 hypothetical protein ABB55_05385 [Prosthecomicrobium hirschii]MBT9290602.1 rod-binding protein [Prosthecodimorpha staleyi]MCW1843967.1 rod-binding protein [Prosthecomicrobium hirschii]TPQ50418.1 chemotaxis protein [Prosthecomicrobium hirschii]
MRMTADIAMPPSALHSVPTADKSGDRASRMRAVAQEYESVFLSSMLKQMMPEIDAKSPFHGGSAEETWRGMLVDQYGKSITKAGGIGIADAVYRELMKVQEGARS